MAIAILSSDRDLQPWVTALKAIDPAIDVRLWPEDGPKDEVTFALCWQQPAGSLGEYPSLRCVSSMGAGVDHLLGDPALPAQVPVVRLVDPGLAQGMFEYVCAAAMAYFREFDRYQVLQQQRRWWPYIAPTMKNTTIGVMGLGQLGRYVAEKLAQLGFAVRGWSRSPKSIPEVETYHGAPQLGEFLAPVNILVCLLPLTAETSEVLNRSLFDQLPTGACLINVARGEHLVEADLMAALDQGQLRGACLDVFQQEPLPADHPFWTHEKITVTPHCSSITDPRAVAPQVMENYRRMRQGQPLINQVSRDKGY